MEFPLSWTNSERRGGNTWTRALWSSPLAGRIWNTAEATPGHAEATPGRVPCGVPLSLTDSEHGGGDTWARALWSLDACPVEFPLSLTDSERCGGDTWARGVPPWLDRRDTPARHTRMLCGPLCGRFNTDDKSSGNPKAQNESQWIVSQRILSALTIPGSRHLLLQRRPTSCAPFWRKA